MPRDVCLIDVYETLLTVEFAAALDELAGIAEVSPEAFGAASSAVAPGVTTGDITMVDAMRSVLHACGVEPRDSLVRDLVEADRRLLIDSARLHDDAMAFLEMLRSRGVRSALVSNCAENTRPLLKHFGLDALVDSVMLSCEVGWAKPSAEVYRRALAELAAVPDAAVFVDDQADYCDGAARMGITAVQIARDATAAAAARPGTTVVRTLSELERFF